jgi:ABC-type lipoprotein export system ATPase subunit
LPQKAKENMLPRETFRYNMLLPFVIAKKPISQSRVDELVAAYGVGDLVSKPVGSLSGGEQQLVALMGLELIPEKEVFLLDEPFAALDSERSDMVSERLRRLAESGRLVVMISHRDDEPLATRKIVLKRGAIVSDSEGPGSYSETSH